MSKTNAPPPYEEYAEHLSPLEVKVTSNFEQSVRNFKSLVQKSKILSLYKEKQSYEKPSDRKRRKKREVLERIRVAEMREALVASGEWDRRQKKKDQRRKEKLERRRREAQDSLE